MKYLEYINPQNAGWVLPSAGQRRDGEKRPHGERASFWSDGNVLEAL